MRKNPVKLFLLCFLAAAVLYYWKFSGGHPTEEVQSVFKLEDHANKKIILQWTPIFGEYKEKLGFKACPLNDKCVVVYEKSAFDRADAVIFHDLDKAEFPKKAFPDQKFVYYTMESPPNIERTYKWDEVPKNYFDWIMSHLSLSDVHSPYGGYWVNPTLAKDQGFTPVNLPFDELTILGPKKIEGAVWFVSNCNTLSKREIVFRELRKHFRVDIVGACADSHSMKQLCPKGSDCESKKAEYYFQVIAENSICRDYITEKYWYSYNLPLIPIVMKREVYEHKVPRHSFIAVDDFANAQAMAQHLAELVKNKTRYMEYFSWRKDGWATAPWNSEGYRLGSCDLCEKLHRPQAEKPPYPNPADWLMENSNCDNGTFAEQWIQRSH